MAQSQHPTHIEVSNPAPGDGQDIGERQAKQGNRGRHIVIVLTASLALVVLAFLASFALNARPSMREGGQVTVGDHSINPNAAKSFNAPEPAPKIPTPEQSATPPGEAAR